MKTGCREKIEGKKNYEQYKNFKNISFKPAGIGEN